MEKRAGVADRTEQHTSEGAAIKASNLRDAAIGKAALTKIEIRRLKIASACPREIVFDILTRFPMWSRLAENYDHCHG
jgi:hypothetical protein